MLIPVQIAAGAAKGKIATTVEQVEELTFKGLGITEADLEEFIRRNVQLLFPEGESLLIVGQQIRNKEGGRADLVAVDAAGSVVLIELKRDADDMAARKEGLEFQAIRYAASYALLTSPQDLVQRLFAPYVEKHQAEFDLQGLTPSELAARLLTSFLQTNQATNTFNQRQRIALIASDFDPQTLSACAWLAKNGIDIRCWRLAPRRYQQQHFLDFIPIIPPPLLDDYFVALAEQTGKPSIPTTPQQFENLPKLPKLLAWGLLKPGDTLHIKGNPEATATVIDKVTVLAGGQKLSYNEWGKRVTGWSSLNIYPNIVHEPTGMTLDEMRQEKMKEFYSASTKQVPEVPTSDGAAAGAASEDGTVSVSGAT